MSNAYTESHKSCKSPGGCKELQSPGFLLYIFLLQLQFLVLLKLLLHILIVK